MTTETEVYYRKCSTCGKGMNEGYVAEMDGQYACSDKCWFTAGYTPAMYAIDYEGGDAYHTAWGEGDEHNDVAYTKEGETIDLCFKCHAPQFTDSPFCDQCLTHL